MLKTSFHVGVALLLFFAASPRGAQAQIAPGVQQSAAQTATITGTVIQSDGTPLAGADVRLVGPAQLTTKSDMHGAFDFTSVPYGTYRIDVITANLGEASRENLVVKGDISVAIQYAAQTAGGLKTIAHVSTRSAGASINVTPASIASLNPRDYAFQGNASWRELLNQIPGVTVGGNLYGGSSSSNFVPDGPLQPVVLSINGALPYETSVTLDGMPFTNNTLYGSPGLGTNLSFLPMAAFDTADVVRGPGANTPSIVDSIGGSFVLHSPGFVDKDQFEFSISNDPYGGVISNAKVALHVGRLSATITYALNNSPGPFGNQSAISSYAITPVTVNGQPFLSGGSIGYIPNPKYPNCNCLLQNSLLYCCAPLDTSWAQHNGSVALSYAVTPSITAQMFYAGSLSRTSLPFAFIPVDFTPGAAYTGSIAPGLYSFADIALPDSPASQASSLLEEKITAYLGRGVLRLAALQNNSYIHLTVPYYLPDGQYTVYGTGTYANGMSAVFNGTLANLTFIPYTYNYAQWVNNRDILASYETQVGSSSSLGISYVTSYYNYPYMYKEAYNGGNYSGAQPPANSETTNEVRIHAGTRVSDKLSLDASWYFALGSYHVKNPNDLTGATWTDATFRYNAPRFGAVWQISRDIAVRGAAGGGYALPTLLDLLGTNYPPFCVVVCTENLTNLNLKPEESFGFDVGTDMRLHHDTVLSIDLYRTNLYGQFYSSTHLNGTYLGLPLYTSEVGNLSQSRYEGINFDIHRDVSRGIYWHGALGLTRAYVVSVPPGFYSPSSPGCPQQNTYVVPGSNFNGAFGSTVPYANASAQIGYRWSPEKYIDLSPTYYGNNNPYFEPAFVELDAHVSYPLMKNVSLLATFRNITGIYGQNYQSYIPTLGVPTVTGPEQSPLYGIPYGPRAVIVTALFH